MICGDLITSLYGSDNPMTLQLAFVAPFSSFKLRQDLFAEVYLSNGFTMVLAFLVISSASLRRNIVSKQAWSNFSRIFLYSFITITNNKCDIRCCLLNFLRNQPINDWFPRLYPFKYLYLQVFMYILNSGYQFNGVLKHGDPRVVGIFQMQQMVYLPMISASVLLWRVILSRIYHHWLKNVWLVCSNIFLIHQMYD